MTCKLKPWVAFRGGERLGRFVIKHRHRWAVDLYVEAAQGWRYLICTYGNVKTAKNAVERIVRDAIKETP
jgi:hypothetical protein